MPRSPKNKRTPLAQTIRRFRVALGDTQQKFAHRFNLSITSIARYETNSTPAPEILQRMADTARTEGLPKFAELFEQNIPEQNDPAQDFAAVKELLRRRADNLEPARMNDAVLALAFLSDSPVLIERLEKAKERIEERYPDELRFIDHEIAKWADENYLSYPESRRARADEAIRTFEATEQENS